jgi:dienelactone hydrolase
MGKSESFVDFLDRFGSQHPPEMVYREPEAFNTWQARFFDAVQGLRGVLPARVDLDVETVEVISESDHTRHVLHIRVSEISTLVAYLLVPKGLAEGEKRPAIIASHGHVAEGIDAICGVPGVDDGAGGRRGYGLAAVRAGYVVLAPAWWGWPGRDGHLDRVGNRDRCNVINMAAGMYGINVTDLHIQDGQAAVDALVARSEVDGGRIGCIGNSYGGRSTMWLTIFDDRIKACVPAGCMNTFRERSLKLSSCGIQYLPGILRYGDVPELFSLIAPRPMQVQVGDGDGLINDADRELILSTVRQAYEKMGQSDHFDCVQHPDGHLLRWDLAEGFLKKHL